jgi:hypothetical protein
MAMSESGPGTRRAPVIAIAVAALALVVAIAAAVVVTTRDEPVQVSRDPLTAVGARIAAAELARLRHDAVERVPGGLRVTDATLRTALALEPDDVVSRIAGLELDNERDIDTAIVKAGALGAPVIYVELSRGGRSVLARWELDGDLRAARLGHVPRSSTLATRDPLLDTIVKLDDFRYEIPRSTIDRVIANPADFARGARVVPAMQGGRPDGIKLYAIRPSSIWAALGFANGDTIRAVNGHEITSADSTLELYTKLRDARELAIDITRRGKYELITILIR